MAEARDKPRKPENSGSKRKAPKNTLAGETEQLVLTLSAATGEILNIQFIERSGHRRELSDDEYAELGADDDVADEIEAALEDAYETGVADALGEDAEELALRRVVVGQLLTRGVLRHELGRELLHGAIRHHLSKTGEPNRGNIHRKESSSK